MRLVLAESHEKKRTVCLRRLAVHGNFRLQPVDESWSLVRVLSALPPGFLLRSASFVQRHRSGFLRFGSFGGFSPLEVRKPVELELSEKECFI